MKKFNVQIQDFKNHFLDHDKWRIIIKKISSKNLNITLTENLETFPLTKDQVKDTSYYKILYWQTQPMQ